MMKHKNFLDTMTLEEKAAILSGKNVWETRSIDRLSIPSIFLADGPHGVRRQASEGDHLGLNPSLPATCFPTAAAVANSWDEALCEEIGNALGEEANSQGVNVLLGPGLNIKRNPLCGRNFEYFSEDPYHGGKLAASYVRGIQNQGVYACPKHFAVNNQELRRMAMNSVVDERTLREIYLEGFEIAVKEGNAKAIMTSYNEVNGTYANENKHLLKDILRDDWGFDGLVVTDWGGSNDHVKGVAAGSHLEMPSPGLDSARGLLKAIDEGSLTMEELDSCVDGVLSAVFDLTRKSSERKTTFNQKEHHRLAERAAEESIVLLKNQESLLPLPSGCKVALIGDFAVKPRYQGAGSSLVNPMGLETMEGVISKYPLQVVGVANGYERSGRENSSLESQAVELAKHADVVLYCFGLDELSETEGMDRSHMRIPENQIRLLMSLEEVNPSIVGIISAGSAIEMPWEEHCKSILHGYLSGEAGPGAMLNIITGAVNPSGHLNETYPLSYVDTPSFRYFPGKGRNSEYREALYVGYRYYQTAGVSVRYPFGYGLSYTTFEYSELTVTKEGVSFILTNTGSVDGKEVAQLYVGGPRETIFRPEKELKGFAKVFLKAGESKQVSISFDDKTFRYYNTATGQFEVEAGNYNLHIGGNADDVRLSGTIEVVGTTEILPYDPEKMKSYYTAAVRDVETEEFEALLGHTVPNEIRSDALSLNDALCQMHGAKSPLARLVYRILTGLKNRSEAKGKPNLNLIFIYNIPFRGIAKMTNGAVSMEMAEGMVLAANGHFFKGIKKIIGGYFTNAKANKLYEKKLSGK